MADIRWSAWTEQPPKVYLQGLFEVSSVKKHPLGTLRMLSDGRVFAYAKAGSVALAPGKLCQAPAPVANHDNLVVAAASAGDEAVTVTLGATAVAADDYAEGFLIIVTGTGAGCAYKIKTHPAASASASLKVTLYDKLRTALDATSRACLIYNPFSGTVIHPSPPTSKLVGVPLVSVPIGNYYWSQIAGPTVVLVNGTISNGKKVVASATVDGAVDLMALTEGTPNTGSDQYPVGVMLAHGTNTQYGLVDIFGLW